ncbi:MAG: capsule biosynthesis protein CapA [Pseudomonadota bacterium]
MEGRQLTDHPGSAEASAPSAQAGDGSANVVPLLAERRSPEQRRFLFLQGPHGPFFAELSRLLRASGAETRRIGFNRGDAFEWPEAATYTAYREAPSRWADWVDAYLAEEDITDLVLYGDMREVHRVAHQRALARNLRIHCFEEGYLRPYWATYERAGVNGNSRLVHMPVADMQARVAGRDVETPEAPATWGALWHHTWYGFLYHANILLRNGFYPNFVPHRGVTVAEEFALHTSRLLLYPLKGLRRRWRERRLRRAGMPYHLVLLQLSHDSAMRDHSPFATQRDFLGACITAFAEGAPRHHRLVFKAHPLEDGREPLAPTLRRLAARAGISDRVDFIDGGKLGPLLDGARSAVTVNSTAAQQALWRGLPVSAHGRAVYQKPEFVSPQPLAAFFRAPERPDSAAYRAYRRYLLGTSQVRGGFYTRQDRQTLLRRAVDMMLDPLDPYDAFARDGRTLPDMAPDTAPETAKILPLGRVSSAP